MNLDEVENQALVSRIRTRIKNKYSIDKKDKKKGKVKSKNLTVKKVKMTTTSNAKKINLDLQYKA